MGATDEGSSPGKRNTTCKICSKTFRSPYHLRRHEATVHRTADAISEADSRLECPVCNRRVCRADAFLKHLGSCSRKICCGDRTVSTPVSARVGHTSSKNGFFRRYAPSAVDIQEPGTSVPQTTSRQSFGFRIQRQVISHEVLHRQLLKALKSRLDWSCANYKPPSTSARDALDALAEHTSCLLETHRLCMQELGISLLSLYSREGTPWACRRLIDAGLDINTPGPQETMSPLQIFARNGNSSSLATLLNGGADIEARDDLGRTALHLAARHGKEWRTTQCSIAAQCDGVKVLLEHGVQVNATTNRGEHALHLLHYNRKYDKPTLGRIVDLLLDHGAHINAQNNAGETPLMIALQRHDTWNYAKTLLERGADPTVKRVDGRTAADFARMTYCPTESEREIMLDLLQATQCAGHMVAALGHGKPHALRS